MSAGWRRKPTIWELPPKTSLPNSFPPLFVSKGENPLSQQIPHYPTNVQRLGGGGGGGFGGWGGQPRILGPFLLDILDLGGQNINIKY